MHDPENPLLSNSPLVWQRLIESVEPASILLLIEQRMSTPLRKLYSAEDILQEALLHAWRSRAECEWRGLKSFRSWLLTIVDHRIHDFADRAMADKRDGGRPILSFSDLEHGGPTTSPGVQDFASGSTTPSRLAMYREQAEAMRLALAGLPEEVREIVRLRLFDQCPLEEIAARSNLGVSAVRHRFRKGSEIYLRLLRSALSSRAVAPDSTSGPPRESSPGGEPPLHR